MKDPNSNCCRLASTNSHLTLAGCTVSTCDVMECGLDTFCQRYKRIHEDLDATN